MPSAMSRPSEPVETVSTSIERLFLPSRMIEPLPKLRSICDSAASRAFDLSMDDPSTRRSAALMFVLLMAGMAIAPAIALRGHIFCRQFIPREASRCGVRDAGSDHATIGGAQQNLASPPSRIRRTLLSPLDSGVTLKGRRRLSDNPRCRLTEE
jgi:hypothetical protein